MDNTTLFDVQLLAKANVKMILKEVYQLLEERGYNAKNQLIGYLMSGDPGYISSHKEARNKITKFERTKILEILINNFIK